MRHKRKNLFDKNPDDLFQLRMGERELQRRLIDTLAPAVKLPTRGDRPPAVVWVDRDAEALVHTDRLRLALQPGLIIVEMTLATDQSKTGQLIVAYGVGSNAKSAQLLASVEQVPRGDPTLIARWGGVTQEILWQAIVKTGQERWQELHPDKKLQLSGLYAEQDKITFLFSRPVTAREIKEYFSLPPTERPVFDPKPIDVTKPRKPDKEDRDTPDKPKSPRKPKKPEKRNRPQGSKPNAPGQKSKKAHGTGTRAQGQRRSHSDQDQLPEAPPNHDRQS